MINLTVLFITLFISRNSLAIDCSSGLPFLAISSQKVTVMASRFYWDNGERYEDEVCHETRSLPIYDVRGRENEAYYCLKPLPSQIIQCSTQYLGGDATVSIIPASWLRMIGGESYRAYRFHAYIQNDLDPESVLDVFSRSLSTQLANQSFILEGAKISGESSPLNEGFWFRLVFQ